MVHHKYHINPFDNLPFKQLAGSTLGGRLLDGSSDQLRAPPEPAVIFYASKNETFRLGENYKTFHRKLKNRFNFKVIQ